jgi:HlyD family secretion protein
MKVKARSLLLPVLAFVALAGIYLYQHASRGEPFSTAKVERGPLAGIVAVSGAVTPLMTVAVGTQISGQIRAIHVDFNSPVKRGQLLATIDPDALDAKVKQARAELEAAEAQVLTQRGQLERAKAEAASAKAYALNQRAQVERSSADLENARASRVAAQAQTAKATVTVSDAKRDLERKENLAHRSLIARSEADTARTAYDTGMAQLDAVRAEEVARASSVRSAQAQVDSSRAQFEAAGFNVGSAEAQVQIATALLSAAEANVRQKRAALQQALVDVDRASIRSPVDGIVISRNVDVGQTVTATLATPTLFTIAQDLSKLQIEANVGEVEIGRIRPAQPATVIVDSLPNETFSGKVLQIRKVAKLVQNRVTYSVLIGIDDLHRTLLPGMSASVRIVTDSRPDVLKVPNAALRFRPNARLTSPPAEEGPKPSSPAAALSPRTGTVWVADVFGRLRPVTVQLGLTDGAFTEVSGGNLKQGQRLAVAL